MGREKMGGMKVLIKARCMNWWGEMGKSDRVKWTEGWEAYWEVVFQMKSWVVLDLAFQIHWFPMFLLCAKCWLIHKISHGLWFHFDVCTCWVSFWNCNLYYHLKYFLTRKAVAWAQLLLIQALEPLKRYPDPFGFGAQNSWSPQKRHHFGFAQIWNRLLLGPLNTAHPPHEQRHLWTRQGRGWSGKFRATSAEVSPISRLYSRGKSCQNMQ